MGDLQYKNFNLHWLVQRRTVNLFYSCLPVPNVSRTRGGTQCIYSSMHCCARCVAFSSERVKPKGSRQPKQESMDGGVIATPDETKQDDGINPSRSFLLRQTLRYMNSINRGRPVSARKGHRNRRTTDATPAVVESANPSPQCCTFPGDTIARFYYAPAEAPTRGSHSSNTILLHGCMDGTCIVAFVAR